MPVQREPGDGAEVDTGGGERLGDSLLLLADPQDGWKAHPGMLRLSVSDLPAVIAQALERGADLVTPPTPFFGSVDLGRVQDPWGNL